MALHFVAAVQGGGYVSALKVLPVLLVLLIWARLLTWVDKDAPAAHLPRIPLNTGFLGGLILAFALFFYLPGFLIAFPVLLAIFGAEVGTYLILRKQRVGLGDLKEQFKDWLQSLKGKEKVEKELPNQVKILGKNNEAIAMPKSEDPQRPAFDALQTALAEPLRKNAEQIDLAPSDNGIGVKYAVDGFNYRGGTIDRTAGAGAVAMLKGAAGLDVNDRRKPQRGTVKVVMDGKRTEMRLDTAGSTAGEYLRMLAEPKKRHEFTLDTVGFTEKQRQTIRELIGERKGIVLVAVPKGQGLTSALYAVLRGHDAFIEHLHTVERAPDIDLEGITQNKLPANAPPAEEAKTTSWVISQEPDAVMISKIEDPRTAADLIKFAKGGKAAYIGMQAGSTFEALDAWRKLVGDDRLAMEPLRLVVAGRVIRKLCNACKVGYAPDPSTLRKLNMNPEKVPTLYQARTQPLRDQKGNPIPCEFCNDLRFKGRTGVFETFLIDDEVREVVAAGGSPNQLKAVFRKQRARLFQEEALSLVEKGDTSVQEVLRVLKGGESPAPEPAGV